ncbi:MAG TPA: hypothetical protein VLA51_08550 [Paracoccaceae bacterium]|nr:hypothetical protein [Paracoccaceae bacterium]
MIGRFFSAITLDKIRDTQVALRAALVGGDVTGIEAATARLTREIDALGNLKLDEPALVSLKGAARKNLRLIEARRLGMEAAFKESQAILAMDSGLDTYSADGRVNRIPSGRALAKRRS